MGSEHGEAEDLNRDAKQAHQGLLAQRFAQGFRNYLTKVLASQGAGLNGSYEAKTENGVTEIVCQILCDEKVPFKSVSFTMEFEHR